MNNTNMLPLEFPYEQKSTDPVTCLDITFKNNKKHREYFPEKLREFEEYHESKQKRLKVFRLETVHAGFKKAWQERGYATIITVDRKISDKILQKDPKLFIWSDQAMTRTGEQG